MRKNVASQKIAVYAYLTTGDTPGPKTGDAANITAKIFQDGGAAATTDDANPTELDSTNAPGVYLFDLTQGESNADLIVLKAVSATSGVMIEPVILYTEAWPTATEIATAVWNALTSTMSTAGSIGKKLADWVVGNITSINGVAAAQVDTVKATDTGGNALATAAGTTGIMDRLGAPAGASHAADIAAVKSVADAAAASAATAATQSTTAATQSTTGAASAATAATQATTAATQAASANTKADTILARTNLIPDAPAAVGSAMTLEAAVVTAIRVGLSTLQAGDSMTLTAGERAAIIAKLVEDLPDLEGLNLAAIASACRDEILNRVLASNHEMAGSVGKLLQDASTQAATAATQAASANTAAGAAKTAAESADTKTTSIKATTDTLAGMINGGAWTQAALVNAPGGSGEGLIAHTYTVTDSVTGGAIEGVIVRATLTNDPEAATVGNTPLTTNSLGQVQLLFLPSLSGSSVYLWRTKDGVVFTNPDVEVI